MVAKIKLTENTNPLNRQDTQRAIEGAHRYAKMEVSDPFALKRALSHIRSGLVTRDKTGELNCYDADPSSETRYLDKRDGNPPEAYKVEVFKGGKRP